ncbi:MAG: SPOR domain-containing protein [Magnetococcales bacterium]|nr:SPOR domain-containing protein [Magnetococcales bacterium]
MKTSSNREQQLFLVTGGAILFLILAVVVFNMISAPSPVPEEHAEPVSRVHTAESQLATAVSETREPWKVVPEPVAPPTNDATAAVPPPEQAEELAPHAVQLPSAPNGATVSETTTDPLERARRMLEPTPPATASVTKAAPPVATTKQTVPTTAAKPIVVPHPPATLPGSVPPRQAPGAQAVHAETFPAVAATEPRPAATTPQATRQGTEKQPVEKPVTKTPPPVKTVKIADRPIVPPEAPVKATKAIERPTPTVETVRQAQPVKTPPPAKVDYSEELTQEIARQFGAEAATTSTKPTAKPVVTAKSAPSPSGGSRFLIQIASFATTDKAKSMADRVGSVVSQGRRIPVSQVNATVSGKSYFRVRAGPFANRAGAEAALQALGQAGIGGSIVSLD